MSTMNTMDDMRVMIRTQELIDTGKSTTLATKTVRDEMTADIENFRESTPYEEPTITENVRNRWENDKARLESVDKDLEWARQSLKKCKHCKKQIPRSGFDYNTCSDAPFNKDGDHHRRSECKPCGRLASKSIMKARACAKREGIPFKAPAGTVCQLCSNDENIVFDHDHQKDVFRGWLCNGCNRSIGILGDTTERMENVVSYMKGAL